MAIARKCDRCGKYYDENKKYRYNLVMGIDLCDECLGKIKNFLGTDILKERE